MKARASDPVPSRSDDCDLPRVWVLEGHRTGDNLQVRALAEELGWPGHRKSLTWKRNWYKRLPQWTPLYGRSATLRQLVPEAKEMFCPPWPDLVISIGWRSVPIARWIKKQSGAKLVHLGRPRAPLKCFDLVLTTPQYCLPNTNNVVQLNGPLTTLSPDTLAASADTWEPLLAHLPRPWIAALVGGDTPNLKFPTSAAAALAKASHQKAANLKGSLLVVTSPRTSEPVTRVLRDAIQEPMCFHKWTKDTDNPYSALLALADHFIVTNDSVSMMHEAALAGQPLHIFPLTSKISWSTQAIRALDQKLRHGTSLVAKAYLGLIRHGMIYPPKSMENYTDQLFRSGHATTLGSSAKSIGEVTPIQPENERAARAVAALFEPLSKGPAQKD